VVVTWGGYKVLSKYLQLSGFATPDIILSFQIDGWLVKTRLTAVMPREKAAKNPSKQDQKTKTPRDATEKPTLQAALQVQEEGTQTHLQALKTRKTYAGHVQRARQWVKVHLLTEAGTTVPDDFPQADKGAEEISNDPTFPLAFEVTPNKWSAKVTTLYLSWLVFRGNKKKGTAEGVRAALLMQWNEV